MSEIEIRRRRVSLRLLAYHRARLAERRGLLALAADWLALARMVAA